MSRKRSAPYQKGDTVTVTVTDMSESGEGIGRADGYTLFIKDAVIGDVVLASVMKAAPTYGYARLKEILVPSPDRAESPCPCARACGGCQLQAMSYEKQLAFKKSKVRNDLIRLGGYTPEEVDRVLYPIIGMDRPFRYRNKAQYPVGMSRDGRMISGFYAGRTHSIIETGDCLLGPEENAGIIRMILDFCGRYSVPAYDEITHTGVLRHILIRKGFATGQIMVCLVVNGDRLCAKQGEEELADTLFGDVPGMTSLVLNSNTERTNVVLGSRTRSIRGPQAIEDRIGRLSFLISAHSFYQVNPVQTERIYAKALEYAGLTGQETVWDLYCGIGTISLFLSQRAKAVYGIEIVPQAILDARKNAERNGIRNVTFEEGKAEEVLPRYIERQKQKGIDARADVVVVDPPRKGCDERCLETIVGASPERIVYVSCNPATLARDLKFLRACGYELTAASPFDNFSQSIHVETVVLMSRKTT